MKRFLGVVLVLCIILNLFGVVNVIATTNGKCGDNLMWSFNDNTLIISGSGQMYDYENKSDCPWNDYAIDIEKVIFDDNITSIGSYSMNEIRIEKLLLPKKLEKIGSNAFSYSNFEEVFVPSSLKTVEYTNIGYIYTVFYNGTEDEWNTIEFVDEYDSFLYADVVYNYEYGAVSGMCGDNLSWSINDDGDLIVNGSGDMMDFSEAHHAPWYSVNDRIYTVTIGEGVTSVGNNAFNGCYYLIYLDFPSSIKSVGEYSFCYCSSLESIDITEGVQTIKEGAFSYTSLRKVVIPSNVRTIGDYAFESCDNLRSLTIYEGLENVGEDAFYSAVLTSVFLPESLVSTGSRAFGRRVQNVYYAGGEDEFNNIEGINCLSEADLFEFNYVYGLTSGTCGENIIWAINDGVLTVSGNGEMFSYAEPYDVPWYSVNEKIESVVIENGVTKLYDRAFYDCFNLKDVSISKTVIMNEPYYTFYRCYNLETINVDENNNLYSSQDGVLFNKDKTSLIKYPNGNTRTSYNVSSSVILIEESAFEGSQYLETVNIPESVKKINEQAFTRCLCLSNVNFKNGIETIEEFAFSQCYSLYRIVLPDSLTYLGEYAFDSCGGLEEIILSNSLETIKEGTFLNCQILSSIVIPDNVKIIESDAFYGVRYLYDLTIGNGVEEIYPYAFQDCEISAVYYKGTESAFQKLVSDGYNDELVDADVYFMTPVISNVVVNANGDLMEVSVKAKNIPTNAYVFAATYDAYKNLIEAKVIDVETLEVTFDSENVNSVKVFMWSNKLKPICSSSSK